MGGRGQRRVWGASSPSQLWSKDWLVLGSGKGPGASHCLYVLHGSGILHVTQALLGVRRTVGRTYGVQVMHTAAHALQWTHELFLNECHK